MVFQGGALFDSMTVEENVVFPLKMFTKMTKGEMKNRVEEVLDRVNLVDTNDKFPSEISGGMQKRVSIARAIVNKPNFLFVMNPTRVLTQEQLLSSIILFKKLLMKTISQQ